DAENLSACNSEEPIPAFTESYILEVNYEWLEPDAIRDGSMIGHIFIKTDQGYQVACMIAAG
ncbi:MAG: hypothetical protein AAF840_15445, partial [Bacteroidota bacterium]